MTPAAIIFILALTVLAGSYFAYPLTMYFLQLLAGRRGPLKEYYPSLVLITSICDEEETVIAETLKNRLRLKYPKDKVSYLFVADGSPVELINTIKSVNCEKVAVYQTAGRIGKTAALNRAIPSLDSELVVFSDANSHYDREALVKLARHFEDPAIGGVCGELRYVEGEVTDMSGPVSGIYMYYEKIIKQAESAVSTLTIFNGAIYAIRKSLHREMNPQAANDFQHPVQIVLQGCKSLYEPEAVAFEKSVTSDLVEFKRTVRITSRGWKGLFTYPAILNPFRVGSFSLQFMFRKLLRWLSPIFLILMLTCSFLLRAESIFLIFLVLQFLFYLAAFLGWVFRRRSFYKPLYFPYYFCLLNLAALFGLVNFLAGRNTATWKPTTWC